MNKWKENWKKDNLVGSIGGVTTGAINVAANALDASKIEDTSDISNQIQDTASTQFNYRDFDALEGAYNPYAYINKTNASDIRGMSTGAKVGNIAKGIGSGAMAGSALGPYGALAGAIIGAGASLFGINKGNQKAENRATELNSAAELANSTYMNNYINNINNISQEMFNNAAINIAKEGGKIKSNPIKYRGFENTFSYGGDLALSGDFSNGVTIVNEGNSHEDNKYGGVLMGMDENGIPNLVEEGEVIWNDYVFSRRNKPTKSQLREVLLNPRYEGKTYAEIAKMLQKESSENPFDPISKNTLETNMERLMTAQEETRAKKRYTNKNIFAGGGDIELDPITVQAKKNTLPAFSNKAVYNSNFNDAMNKLHNNIILDNIINNTANADIKIDDIPIENIEDVDFSRLNTKVGPVKISNTDSRNPFRGEFLRYWPAIQSGVQVLTDAAGWTNKLDYTNPNLIRNANRGIRNISTRPVGNYISFNPIDVNYQQQQLVNQGLGTQRNILNATSGNRNAAIASLIALNNNMTSQSGDLYRQGNLTNAELNKAATQLNAGINTTNAQLGLQGDARNQTADLERVNNTIREAILRDQNESAWSQAKSQNITNFGNNIGGVGRDAFNNRLSFDYIRALGLEDQYRNYVLRNRRYSKNGGPLHIKLGF